MTDGNDFPDDDFEWRDEPVRDRTASQREPEPNGEPRTLAGDLDRLARRTAASPRRIVVVALVLAVAIAVVLVVVLSSGGSKRKESAAPTTTSPETAPASTETQPAPAPPTTPAAPAIHVPTATMLNLGDRGPAVRTLQRALRRLGFAVGAPDGFFGPKTGAAVSAFQRAHGLDADGVVGAKTARALNRAVAQAG